MSGLALFMIYAGCWLMGVTWLAFAVTCWPAVGVGLIAGTLLAEAFFIRLPGIHFLFNIYPQDVIFVTLSVGAAIRWATGRASTRSLLVPEVLLLTFMGSFARGVFANGATAAGVDARGTFYFLACLLYSTTLPSSMAFQRRFVRTWLVAAGAMAALALFRWLATLAGLGIASQWAAISLDAGGGRLRVLVAAQAMFLAVSMFLALDLALRPGGARWQRWLATLLAAEVVLLQHRTVWVASLACMAWLIIAGRGLRRRFLARAGAVALLCVAVYLVFASAQSTPLVASLQASATDTRTWEWRVEGWRQLLAQDEASTPINRLFGVPFGSGYVRYINGYPIEVSPHNFYVQVLLRMGVVGLFCLIGLYASALLRHLKPSPIPDRDQTPSNTFWQLTLVAQLLFFVTYSPSYEQGLLLGMALAVASPRRQASASDQRRPQWQYAA